MAASVIFTEPKQGAAPAPGFAEHDKVSVAQVLEASFPRRATAPPENASLDAAHLGETFRNTLQTARSADPRQPVLLYVSGHGCSGSMIGTTGKEDAYLLPVDFTPSDKLERQYAVSRLLEEVASLPAQCKVLAIDYGPIERDLRLGTAVNQFAEILESELRGLTLRDGETFVVITSHRTWEKSLVAQTADGKGRGVFSYFFTTALGEVGNENTADAVTPDNGIADEQISVAELARFVQTQVSDWTWNNTGYFRTQRPLVLVKSGASSLVRIETPPEEDSDAERAMTSLAEVVLCRTPKKSEAKKSEEATPPTAKEEAGAGKSAALLRSAISLSLVQAPTAAPTTPAKTAPAETPPPATAPPTPTSPSATPPTTPPPAAAAPLPPGWFSEQVEAGKRLGMDGANGAAANGNAADWSPTDFAVAACREQLDFLLDRQQRELAGLGPRSGSGPSLNVNAADRDFWRPLQVTQVDAVPWSKGVRTRNAVLMQLPLLMDAVDRVEGENADRLRDQLDELLTALDRFVPLTDRDVLTETRDNTSSTFYAPLPLTSTQCDTSGLGGPHKLLIDAHDQLLASLRGVAADQASPALWLNRWELGQSLPLALIDPQKEPPLWKPPVLSVRKAAAADESQLPTDATPESVENGQLDRCKRWLQMQCRVAKLLGVGPPPPASRYSEAKAADAARLNEVARDLRDLHVTAAKNWSAFQANSPKASDHLKADLAGRLAVVLAKNPAQPPRPGPQLTGEAPPVRLGLTGPQLAGGSASTDAVSQAIHLKKEQATTVTWHVRTDNPLDREKVLVELRFDPRDLRVQTQAGQDLVPTQPGQGPIPLTDLLVEGQPTLAVKAQREIRPDEAMTPGGNSKPLEITLRLGDRVVQGATRFQLPDPRYLEVQVAGYKATVRRGAEVAAPAEMGRSWFKMPPDDSQSTRRPESGDFRVELFPFPRFATEFGLRLISAKERKLTATWYVPPPQTVPNQWPDWNRTLDSMQKFARSATVAPGVAWQVPLFDTAPPAPPPTGTTPPPPMPESLAIENGLLLVLTDEQEPQWRQRIWIHTRPLHPDQYLTLLAQYRTGKPGTTPDLIEVAMNSLADVREQLKPGALPVSWFELADARIGRPPPTPRDFSLPDQPAVVAQLARQNEPFSGSILAILNIDGYPRAARLPGIRPSEAPVEHERQPYLYFQLFEELPPAAPAPPGGPAPPPNLKLLEGTRYTSAPLKLAYKLFADFDPRLGQLLRVVENGNESSPLVRRTEDRDFKIAARKPENPTGPQLSLDCQIGEWQGSLGEIEWLQLGNNVIRAEIVTAEGGRERPLAAESCQVEYAIVLDDEKPKVGTDVTITSIPTRFVGENVLCRFSVFDKSLDRDNATSGVAIEGLSWATDVKGDTLVDPRPILESIKEGPNKPGVEATGRSLLCELPAEIATAKPGRVRIFIQATDRAGNVGMPTKVLELEVKMKRELELIPGSGKAAKAKP